MKKQIHTEIIIYSTRQKVWEHLTKFESYPCWNPFLISIEGKLHSGSTIMCTLKNESKKIIFKPTILDVHPNRSFSWTGKLFFKGLFDGFHYFKIEEVGENRVKFIQGESFSGLLSSLILSKIGKKTEDGFKEMNFALKQLVEHSAVLS
jgi:hypothetical protein